jgi:hypothetical protein
MMYLVCEGYALPPQPRQRRVFVAAQFTFKTIGQRLEGTRLGVYRGSRCLALYDVKRGYWRVSTRTNKSGDPDFNPLRDWIAVRLHVQTEKPDIPEEEIQ